MNKILNRMLRLGTLLILVGIWFSPIDAAKATYRVATSVDQNRTEQVGPPWLDEGWHFRRPVIITNSGGSLPYYQVLISLNESNFDFTHAKNDGSDIRFTDSSGKNLISFWIESWNYQNRFAYVWVLVSSISPEPYNTIVYLYYDNPSADTASNGTGTFDFFDDFGQFIGSNCTISSVPQSPQPYGRLREQNNEMNGVNQQVLLVDPWCVLYGTPSVNSGILTLNDNSGIKSTNLFQYQAVGYRANYGLGTGHESIGYFSGTSGPQTMIGDLPIDPDGLYLINFPDDNSAPLGINDWHNAYHIYEVGWGRSQSTAYLDHDYKVSNSVQVPTNLLPISVENNDLGPAVSLKLDWLYVRQYRIPEPTIEVGIVQGLVDLRINTVDFPDPIPANKELTYLLTISNNSNFDAHNAVVTNTLPASVDFVSVNPVQGCSVAGKDVVCNISLIASNTFTSVTIVGKTTTDGEIRNTALVTSFDYDKDLSNNINERGTLVDSVAPTVIWVQPTTQAQIFISHGGTVTLEASASDNDQVDYVEFWWYKDDYLLISKVVSPPYITTFNSNLLDLGIDYFFEARAFDRAGNSNISNSRAYIFIRREAMTFLPILSR